MLFCYVCGGLGLQLEILSCFRKAELRIVFLSVRLANILSDLSDSAAYADFCGSDLSKP